MGFWSLCVWKKGTDFFYSWISFQFCNGQLKIIVLLVHCQLCRRQIFLFECHGWQFFMILLITAWIAQWLSYWLLRCVLWIQFLHGKNIFMASAGRYFSTGFLCMSVYKFETHSRYKSNCYFYNILFQWINKLC